LEFFSGCGREEEPSREAGEANLFICYSSTCFQFLLLLLVFYIVITAMGYMDVLSFQYCVKLGVLDDSYVCMVSLFFLASFFSSFIHKVQPQVMT